MNSLDEWKASQLTEAAVALIVQQSLYPRPAPCPVSYKAFRLLPRTASIVSFNWDGLAEDCCPQHAIFHPHGRLYPRRLTAQDFIEWLDLLQDLEKLSAEDALGAPIVLPGEEDRAGMKEVHEEICQCWLQCQGVVIIGFRMGLGPTAAYDHIWRDVFVEALSANRVPVEIVAPDAAELAVELGARLRRSLNIVGWNLNWSVLARVLTRFRSLEQALSADDSQLWYMYDREEAHRGDGQA